MNHACKALLAIACLSLVACSGGSNSRIDYKEAKTLPTLDVPPDLGVPVDTGSENIPERVGVVAAEDPVQSGSAGTGVLHAAEGIRIARDGSRRWLVIEAPAEQLWPKLREFWASLGLEVKVDEPRIGIMETQWAENRADAPGGFLTGLVKSVFKNAYSADTRDKYRIRLEPLGDERTELYLTHYGLKEVVAGQNEEYVETAWQVRPSDPELAAELLNRLVLYLGGSEEVASAARGASVQTTRSRARLEGETLVLDEGFSRAWRLTGMALDRIGLVVEDRNRSEGIYYISRVDQLADAGLEEEGWFSSLFSSEEEPAGDKPKQLQVRLNGGESTTRIRIRGADGEALTAKQSQPILQRLQESLR